MSGRSVLLLASLLAVGACDISSSDRSRDNVTINADQNGNVSFNLPFMHGQVKLPQSMLHNSNFDIDGVKMIPGGTIHGFSMDAAGRGANVHLAFEAPASPDVVRAYFVNEFRRKGDEAVQSGSAVTGKAKDGDTFVIDVAPAAQGSSGTITIRARH